MSIANPKSTRRLAFVAAAVLTLIASQAQAQTAKSYDVSCRYIVDDLALGAIVDEDLLHPAWAPRAA